LLATNFANWRELGRGSHTSRRFAAKEEGIKRLQLGEGDFLRTHLLQNPYSMSGLVQVRLVEVQPDGELWWIANPPYLGK